MTMRRERDPLAALLTAIKAYFVEPLDCEPAGADVFPSLSPQDPGPAPRGWRVSEPAAPSMVAPLPTAQVIEARADAPPAVAPASSPALGAPHPSTPTPAPPPAPVPPEVARPRPVLAVFGLAPGCGTSSIARALALELAARDPARAAAVSCDPPRGRVRGSVAPGWLTAGPLSTAPVGLAGTLADFPGAEVRTAGRLCLVAGADRSGLAEGVPHLAPLVLDEGAAAVGGVAAAVADRSVVVTTPSLEPALAVLAAECISRVGPDPIVVVNRVPEGDPTPADGSPSGLGAPAPAGQFEAMRLSSAVPLPESRIGARLALRGKEPRGELQRAIVRLADRCLS